MQFEQIKKVYSKPKLIYFLPFIGFIFYMIDSLKYGRLAGLMDIHTPGGKIMQKFTKRLFCYLNVLLIVYFAINLVFNIAFFVWKNVTLKAINANEHWQA